jgi:hypothetical protein
MLENQIEVHEHERVGGEPGEHRHQGAGAALTDEGVRRKRRRTAQRPSGEVVLRESKKGGLPLPFGLSRLGLPQRLLTPPLNT